jgi:membrane protease subunit HflK
MAWNEPGSKGDDKDPWTGKEKRPNSERPDFDEILRKLQLKIAVFFDQFKTSQKRNIGTNKRKNNQVSIIAIVLVLIGLWFLSGVFIVQPAERAVVLYFGKYHKTLGPGIHWLPRFIASETKVNIQKIYTYTYPPNKEMQEFTQDGAVVSIAITITYRITDPQAYLFNIVNPAEGLTQAAASALQQTIGSNNLTDILTTGREQIRDDIKNQLVMTLSHYNSGMEVLNVAISSARIPEAVKAATNEVTLARVEGQNYINQAKDYAMQVQPIAKGQAERLIDTAKAYQQQVVLQAQANIASYLALLPEDKRAPQITRERLYLDAIEHILTKSSKVLVDLPNSSIVYLPLDKIMQKTIVSTPSITTGVPSVPAASTAPKVRSKLGSRPMREQVDGYNSKGGPYE